MRSKYIVLDKATAIIFPATINHDDMAAYLRREGTVTGAGFVIVSGDGVSVYGRSESLNMDPDPENDKIALEMALGWL